MYAFKQFCHLFVYLSQIYDLEILLIKDPTFSGCWLCTKPWLQLTVDIY